MLLIDELDGMGGGGIEETPAAETDPIETNAEEDLEDGKNSPSEAEEIAAKKQKDLEMQKIVSARIAEKQKQLDEKYAPYKGAEKLYKKLNELGVAGETPDDLIYSLMAEAEGLTQQEVKTREEGKAAKLAKELENHPEVVAARESKAAYEKMQMDMIFREDLETIKAAFPNVKAEKITDLGEVYIALAKTGMDPVEAYAAQDAINNFGKKEKPASMGGIKKMIKIDNDYISKAEYERLEAEDPKFLDKPGMMEKVKKSIPKWGK